MRENNFAPRFTTFFCESKYTYMNIIVQKNLLWILKCSLCKALKVQNEYKFETGAENAIRKHEHEIHKHENL